MVVRPRWWPLKTKAHLTEAARHRQSDFSKVGDSVLPRVTYSFFNSALHLSPCPFHDQQNPSDTLPVKNTKARQASLAESQTGGHECFIVLGSRPQLSITVAMGIAT
jgi:hypothetical protein